MADLTLQLAWYRLAESCSQLAVWYDDFTWRQVDVLDMLLIGWLAAAFLAIGVVHAVIRLRRAGVGWRPGTVLAVTAGGSGETVRWLNSVMSWLRERQRTDWLVDECLKALTEVAKKHTVTVSMLNTIRYEMLFNVRSKANMSQLNLPHGTKKCKNRKTKK